MVILIGLWHQPRWPDETIQSYYRHEKAEILNVCVQRRTLLIWACQTDFSQGIGNKSSTNNDCYVVLLYIIWLWQLTNIDTTTTTVTVTTSNKQQQLVLKRPWCIFRRTFTSSIQFTPPRLRTVSGGLYSVTNQPKPDNWKQQQLNCFSPFCHWLGGSACFRWKAVRLEDSKMASLTRLASVLGIWLGTLVPLHENFHPLG